MKRQGSAQPGASWWPPLVIFAAACAFCWPVFTGRVMLPADMCLLMLPWRASTPSQFPWFHQPHNPMLDPIQQYLPWRIYAVESLRAGVIPLWNPYAFCGTPFLANLQSALLYPLNLLFLITGARHGFGVSAILHLTLGGLLSYAFLRSLALRRPAALCGALVVMFNGYTVAWLEYPTLSLWVFMWLPMMLWCYERSLRARGGPWALLCALALGMQFLGGHLQVSAYVLIAFALYVVIRLIRPGADGVARPVTAALAAAPLALGLALAAAQVLPTLELAGHSGRAAHGPKGAVAAAFPLTHLVLYLIPNFFGNPVAYNYWGHFRDPSAINFFETACYVGVLPLLLAVWSLRRWREPSWWFFAALTAFAVLAAIGSPVYLLLYHLVPGFRELAGLGRVLCLAAFGLAGLAALGLDDLLTREKPALVRPVFVFGGLAILFVFASLRALQPLISEMGAAFWAYLNRQIIGFVALLLIGIVVIQLRSRLRLGPAPFGWLALAAVGGDLIGFGIGFNPFMPARMAYPETDSIRWLRHHVGHSRFTSLSSDGLDWMPHNAPMVFGLRDIHGSDSLRVRGSFELVSPPGADQARYPSPESPLMNELAVRYLMTRGRLTSPWRLVHAAEAPIYENPAALPRAYLTREGEERLPMARSQVTFARDDANAVTLVAEGSQPGVLVLTDSYYPGWRAWVDGRPVEIRLVNRAFRGIAVSSGRHNVELRYEPASFRVGLFVSLTALWVLSGGAGALLLRRVSASRIARRS